MWCVMVASSIPYAAETWTEKKGEQRLLPFEMRETYTGK